MKPIIRLSKNREKVVANFLKQISKEHISKKENKEKITRKKDTNILRKTKKNTSE